MEKQLAPFEIEDIEDVRIIIKAKGKHYSVLNSGNKEDSKASRVALVQVLLSMEGEIIVVPALEDIDKEKFKIVKGNQGETEHPVINPA